MRAILCHNPTAGTKGHDKDSVLAALRLADYDVRYVSVKDENFLDNLKSELNKAVDLVVAAGGDGTIAEVLISLPDRSVPIGILPLGTANNFARSMGIGGTPQELVETWRIDHIRPVNIGSATGHWGTTSFLEGFGAGAIAQFLKAASKKKKPEGADNLRKGRMLLQKVLKDTEPFDVVMKIDGKSFERSVLGVEVCNIAFTGPGLPIAATANSSDGKLDVISFEPDNREALIAWIDSPLDEKPPVTSRKAAKVELIWRAAPNRVDDEFFNGKDRDEEQTVAITCDKAQVRVLVPAKHPTQKIHEKAASE